MLSVLCGIEVWDLIRLIGPSEVCNRSEKYPLRTVVTEGFYRQNRYHAFWLRVCLSLARKWHTFFHEESLNLEASFPEVWQCPFGVVVVYC